MPGPTLLGLLLRYLLWHLPAIVQPAMAGEVIGRGALSGTAGWFYLELGAYASFLFDWGLAGAERRGIVRFDDRGVARLLGAFGAGSLAVWVAARAHGLGRPPLLLVIALFCGTVGLVYCGWREAIDRGCEANSDITVCTNLAPFFSHYNNTATCHKVR